MTISPAPPLAALSLPWDDPDETNPVAALAAARAELGDTFDAFGLARRVGHRLSRVGSATPRPNRPGSTGSYPTSIC